MKYPVGIQTFSEIREEGYVYVDKTALIYKLIDEIKFVFLSRPRRFGKSLLLSTIQAYFEGRKELFEGLAIEMLAKEWKKYPVLRFDLSGASYTRPQTIKEKLKAYLSIYEKTFELERPASPEEALRQIEERGYAERFEADNRTKIHVGVNFSTDKRTIESWEIKRIG